MSKKPRKLVIAVTGLNAIDSPGPGVAVIRAIRECPDFDVRIIGLSYDALEPGIYLHDIVDKTYQIPYPSVGTDSLMDRLRFIHEIEKIDVIIPNFDAELFNFIKISAKLNEMGIKTFLPEIEQFNARDKMKLFGFGQKNGLPFEILPQDGSLDNRAGAREVCAKIAVQIFCWATAAKPV